MLNKALKKVADEAENTKKKTTYEKENQDSKDSEKDSMGHDKKKRGDGDDDTSEPDWELVANGVKGRTAAECRSRRVLDLTYVSILGVYICMCTLRAEILSTLALFEAN